MVDPQAEVSKQKSRNLALELRCAYAFFAMAFSRTFIGHSVSANKRCFASRMCLLSRLSKNRGAPRGCSAAPQSTTRRRTALHNTALHDNDPNHSHAQLLGNLPPRCCTRLLPMGVYHQRRPPTLPGGDVGRAHRSANCRSPRADRWLGAIGPVANISLYVESRFEHRPAITDP